MKTLGILLLVLGAAGQAQAYEDYQYQKLADCKGSGYSLLIETAPAGMATLKLSKAGSEIFNKPVGYDWDTDGSLVILDFSYDKNSTELYGYVEYCGEHCFDDNAMINLTDAQRSISGLTLQCQKLI